MTLYIVLTQHLARFNRRHDPGLFDACINDGFLDLFEGEFFASRRLNGSIFDFVDLTSGAASDRECQRQRNDPQARQWLSHGFSFAHPLVRAALRHIASVEMRARISLSSR